MEDRLGGRHGRGAPAVDRAPRIAFIGGPKSIEQVRARLAGAEKAVEAFGAGEVAFLETRAMDFSSGRQAAETLLAGPRSKRPDAIFAANDLVAIGALQALTMAGVSVPADIALIGYDDIEFAGAAAIPLTSVRQPAVAIGETAVRILLEEIAEGPTADQVAARQAHAGADRAHLDDRLTWRGWWSRSPARSALRPVSVIIRADASRAILVPCGPTPAKARHPRPARRAPGG